MSSPALDKFMDRVSRRSPPKRSYTPWLLLASGLAVAGGITVALACRRQPAFDVTPLPPRAIPDGSPDASGIPEALSSEDAWRQFWYDRGYRGEPLGIAPEPTDTFWALGAAERNAQKARRNLAANPPAQVDWQAAGIKG